MPDSAVFAEALAAVVTRADHVSLHTGDPAGTGANEVAGGSPAYARVAITSWTAGPEDGVYTATLAGPFDVPADTEIIWAGLWDGSDYLDKAPAFATTVAQDTVEIVLLQYVVPVTEVV